MMETLLKLSPPTMAIVGFLVLRTYLQSKYPSPSALGRVLPKLCVVDSDEMLHYKEVSEEEWKSKPHARPALLRNQVRIHWFYFGQMKANIFRFQQVIRFEKLKIDSAKSSFEYDPREVLILNLNDELAALRSEIFRARLDLLKDWIIRRAVDQERLQTLLGKYKGLEHEMIELASMAKDKTCRDMLVERLGLTRWRILNGGSEPEPA